MSSMRCQILDPISQLDGDVLTFSMHQWEILIKKIPTLQRYFLQNQFDLNKFKKIFISQSVTFTPSLLIPSRG